MQNWQAKISEELKLNASKVLWGFFLEHVRILRMVILQVSCKVVLKY